MFLAKLLCKYIYQKSFLLTLGIITNETHAVMIDINWFYLFIFSIFKLKILYGKMNYFR